MAAFCDSCDVFKESALRPILSSSRDVSLYIYLSIYMSPFMRFSQGSKGGPRGAKPVCLLKELVHHLQFPDEKMCSWLPSELCLFDENSSITCNLLMKKSRIRETKHLSTDADSSTNATIGWTKNSRTPKFFEKRKKSSKTQKLKTA